MVHALYLVYPRTSGKGKTMDISYMPGGEPRLHIRFYSGRDLHIILNISPDLLRQAIHPDKGAAFDSVMTATIEDWCGLILKDLRADMPR